MMLSHTSDLASSPVCESSADHDGGHWSDFALCKGMTETFFGPAGERPQTRRRREALANSYCRLCPVASICKTTARENNEHGFWGGETEEERAEAGFAPKSPSRRTVIAARDRAEERATKGPIPRVGEEQPPTGEGAPPAGEGDEFVIRRLTAERV